MFRQPYLIYVGVVSSAAFLLTGCGNSGAKPTSEKKADTWSGAANVDDSGTAVAKSGKPAVSSADAGTQADKPGTKSTLQGDKSPGTPTGTTPAKAAFSPQRRACWHRCGERTGCLETNW